MDSKEKNHSAATATIRAKATTQSILGNQSEPPAVRSQWARQYEHLRELRSNIMAKKVILAKDANANSESPLFGEHLADAATDSYDRDWALGMLSSEQSALYEIEAAMDRISNGSYGICELTGQPIEAGRLQAIPWTRFCAAAQKELEANGALKRRTQLGELRSYYQADDGKEATDEEGEAPVAAGEKASR